jgi:hypothetical protein
VTASDKRIGKWIATIRDPDLNIRADRSGWEETGNPVYVWQAVAVCTQHKKPLPDWIITYLAEVAQRMTSADARAAKDLRKVLPKIMGFTPSHGPGRPLDPDGGGHDALSLAIRCHALSLAILFATEIEKGLKPSAAIRKAAAALPDDVASRDERTLMRWMMQAAGLERRPRTNAEWREALRSSLGAFAALLEQESRETPV